MQPRQAAGLLTSNSLHLITACNKGLKGKNYAPILDWYDMLLENSLDLADLLAEEME